LQGCDAKKIIQDYLAACDTKDRIHRLGLPDGQYTQYYLQEKEQIMLDAIENNKLETVTTTQEDLDLILNGLI
jgi:hypothetical protein